MVKDLSEGEKFKRIKITYESAKAIGWFLVVGNLFIIGYLLYLSIFTGLPIEAAVGSGIISLALVLIGIYFIKVGRGVGEYKENFQKAKKSNEKLFNSSLILLIIRSLLIPLAGGGSFAMILFAILVYYSYRAKAAFK